MRADMDTPTPDQAVPLPALVDQARDYATRASAPNTRRAHRTDWRHFTAWCIDHDVPPLPASPQSLALYLTDLAAGHKVATLQRRLGSIARAHRLAGLESPTRHPVVSTVWTGIRRSKGTLQVGKVPLETTELRAMVVALPEDRLIGIRDRALLLLGYAGAFRRSELVSLDVADLATVPEGLVVTLRRSKTDQDGAGHLVGIPLGTNSETCPVRALQSWLAAAAIVQGPIFRGVDRHDRLMPNRLSDRAVARAVKRAASTAGFDPSLFSGHSLRAGLATAAARAGVSERAIMAQTRHRSLASVRRYIRFGGLFSENAAGSVGL